MKMVVMWWVNELLVLVEVEVVVVTITIMVTIMITRICFDSKRKSEWRQWWWWLGRWEQDMMTNTHLVDKTREVG